jgi:pyruvate kinase
VFNIAEQKALESGLARNGDAIIAVAGVPVGVAGTTNTLKVRIVGDVLVKGRAVGIQRTVNGSSRVIKVMEETEHFFKRGDILVTTKTTDDMMPYIKKAGAIVVGTWENVDNSHAETVARALDIPLIIAKQRVTDSIPDGIAITVDSKNGFVYNGYKETV